MENYAPLINKGLYELGEEKRTAEDAPRTIIIFGVPRSGTSIISGVLNHLGVFSGNHSLDPVYEDLVLRQAILSGSLAEVKKIVDDYNNRHKIWFYKHPDLISDAMPLALSGRIAKRVNKIAGKDRWMPMTGFKHLQNTIRNPRYIITFKDTFAIANRNRISMEADILKNMVEVLRTYKKIPVLLNSLEPNAFLISSEKIVPNKVQFVEDLIQFCQLNPSEEQRQKAIDFISEKPTKYLRLSRKYRPAGFLDMVSPKAISGWAKYIGYSTAVDVVLLINGKEVATTSADLFRKDLLEQQVHPTGECGFCFTDFDASELKPGAEVRVKIVDDVLDLQQSPYIVPENQES